MESKSLGPLVEESIPKKGMPKQRALALGWAWGLGSWE